MTKIRTGVVLVILLLLAYNVGRLEESRQEAKWWDSFSREALTITHRPGETVAFMSDGHGCPSVEWPRPETMPPGTVIFLPEGVYEGKP